MVDVKHSKTCSKDTSYLYTLRYVQAVQLSTSPISVMNFSFDNKYLATGGHDGVIRIWKILTPDDKGDPLAFINPEPYREYTVHTKSITDISWNSVDMNLLLS